MLVIIASIFISQAIAKSLKPSAQLAPASPCPDVNLSDRMGPVRNQTSSDMCYAFVSADLIGFAQGITPKDQISVLDVAARAATTRPIDIRMSLKSNFSQPPEMGSVGKIETRAEKAKANRGDTDVIGLIRGGSPNPTIAAYQTQKGYCTEHVLRSQRSEIFAENPDQPDDANEASAESFLGQRIASLSEGQPARDDAVEKVAETLAAKQGHLSPLITSPGAPSAQSPKCVTKAPNPLDLREIAEVTTATALAKLKANIDRACAQRTPFRPMKISTDANMGKHRFNPAAVIKDALAKHLPIGIAYDEGFLKTGFKTPPVKAGHVSSVVGSRPTKNGCEFLIRNSWGSSCNGYPRDVTKNCIDGNIWVPESVLAERIAETTVVEPN